MTHALIAEGGRQFGRMHGNDFHPFLGLLCMMLVGAAIGLGVWLVVRRRPAPVAPAAVAPAAPSPTAAAEAILAERLARGEIAPDDYRTHLAALRGEAPTA
jgi:putative membrane protein